RQLPAHRARIQEQILANRQSRDNRFARAVGTDQVYAERDRVAWGRHAHGLSVEDDSASGDGCQPEQRPPDAFLAGAPQSDKTDDLPGAHPAVKRPRAVGRHAVEYETRVALVPLRPAKHLRGLAADDQED